MRLLFTFICIFLLTSCTSEYRSHFLRENTVPYISYTHENIALSGTLYTLPDVGILDNLVKTIDDAKFSIWIEIYTWTEKETLSAVLRAKERGVDVRVVLEGNVFRTPFINKVSYEKLKNAGIPVIYADNSRYTFTHAKFWLIDNTWCIDTGNLAYSSFKKNRDYIYCSKDIGIYENLKEVFLSDFSHEKPFFGSGIDSRMGLSPINMRIWIEDHLKNAKNTIYIYNQSVVDKNILRLLSEKKKEGLDVKVCHANNETDSIKDLNFPYVSLKKPYLHAKMFLIDENEILLGSINLTSNALDNNREVAISIQKNNNLYRQLKKQFLNDCFP